MEHGKTIVLIIDHSRDLCADMADLFELHEYAVWQAADETEALSMMDNSPRLPNIILYSTDDVSRSARFVQRVRAKSNRVRLVYLIDIDYWLVRWHEPVEDVLYKPFRADDLINRVQAQLIRQNEQSGGRDFPLIDVNGPRVLVILRSARLRDHLQLHLYHALVQDKTVLSHEDAEFYHRMAQWIEMAVIENDAETLARIAQARENQPRLPIMLITDQADHDPFAGLDNLVILCPPVSAIEFVSNIRRFGGAR